MVTYKRGNASLWVGALTCVLVVATAPVIVVALVALVAWAARLLAGGLVCLISLACVGGVAQ